jgi:hypothetical protein
MQFNKGNSKLKVYCHQLTKVVKIASSTLKWGSFQY